MFTDFFLLLFDRPAAAFQIGEKVFEAFILLAQMAPGVLDQKTRQSKL